MFDFVNYTYSGVLSILSTLFGLSYPLVIGCIEKIDDKFGSTKLSERFMSETSFKWFKTSLVINLVMAVVPIFDGWLCSCQACHGYTMFRRDCFSFVCFVPLFKDYYIL